ncbi:DUF6302 family protein [Streptomyces sp. NPDC002018]|uniref:DUF6302 family protein n=1 Tax=Streptomyces sp. NPDC002018 TaxID=3364629 RepID=UPI0036865BA7
MSLAVPAPLHVHLRPPWQAYNYEYVRSRLADPRLAAVGVAIQVFRAPLLAVPVGGCRRGGFFIVDDERIALAVCDALWGQPGFPSPRFRWAPSPDHCYIVEWGETAPSGDTNARGRFYGYSDRAITDGRFDLPPLPGTDSGAASDSLSGQSRADPPQHRDQPKRGLVHGAPAP